ncbi:MAG: DegT/DnrJ/EryC1/StrS family aminotransferase [Clostridiales Family XIII bacterium]|jgi:dTDP-4-amino-4,6-dideoxygalactose transaminase|nr:DegT/DnrJ/EryC1/StrS family aminotransferase [Clostridiales Family XIII bacterium]
MIRLIKPYIEFSDVEDEFRGIFESGIFTRGEYSVALPERLSAYTGAKHAFNATSATTALSACLAALNIGAGDEVVVSDFSFPATVNVVEACGARPVFADVSRSTYNTTADELERKITPRTRAVIFVCALGNPDGIEGVDAVCKKRGVPLIVDAACALGSKSNGIPVGAIGDFTCFSFHPRKLLTSGEGGAITTDDDAYADTLRVKLAHGAGASSGKMEFVTYGYNYRLPELQCVMLIKQLEALDEIVGRRIAQQESYRGLLEPRGFTAQRHGAGVLHNMQSVVFTVPDGTDRDGLVAQLRERGVETTLGTYCQSACRYYREKYGDVQPHSLWLERNTLTLPCHDGVDAEAVAEAITGILGQ